MEGMSARSLTQGEVEGADDRDRPVRPAVAGRCLSDVIPRKVERLRQHANIVSWGKKTRQGETEKGGPCCGGISPGHDQKEKRWLVCGGGGVRLALRGG